MDLTWENTGRCTSRMIRCFMRSSILRRGTWGSWRGRRSLGGSGFVCAGTNGIRSRLADGAAWRADLVFSDSDRVASVGEGEVWEAAAFVVGDGAAGTRHRQWVLCGGAEPDRARGAGWRGGY